MYINDVSHMYISEGWSIRLVDSPLYLSLTYLHFMLVFSLANASISKLSDWLFKLSEVPDARVHIFHFRQSCPYTMGNENSSSSTADEPQVKHVAQIDSPIDGFVYSVDFECRPFAKGSCRFAFRALYRGRGPKNGQRCVLKVTASRGAKTADDYWADLKASRKAQQLAIYFNEDYVSSKPMSFILPVMATVQCVGESNSLVSPGDKVVVEEFIKGDYEKFNNNTSYQSDEVATVPCFSHYTYYKTGGKYLVCDIQGVRTPSGYVLTDPAVHSLTGSYGDTDLGQDGMTRFFSSHRCTSVCVRFPISDLKGGFDRPEKYLEVTRKTYCGGTLNGHKCECCDTTCGPSNGCNCVACMRRDIRKFDLSNSRALVNREGAVSKISRDNNKFYCGRQNMVKDKMTDGFCGPYNGNNCHACRQLDIQARDRYREIVREWYSDENPLVVPTSVVNPR